MQSAGTVRLERALALTGASALGLLAAWKIAPRISDAVDSWTPLRALSIAMVYRNQVLLGQFAAYATALTLGIGFGVAWAFSVRDRSRHPQATRLAGWLLALLAVGIAVTISTTFASFVLVVMCGAAALLTPHVGAGIRAVEATSTRRLSAFVLCSEVVSAAWGLILVAPSRKVGPFIGLGILLLAITLRSRLGRGRRSLDAIAGAPLLLLPLLGFARTPSAMLLVAAAAVVLSLRVALARRFDVRLPWVLAAVGAPMALAAIVMVPLGFRDLPSVNHGEHESFNLAWINSILHGKLLLADAGLVHGPLRTYSLAAFLFPVGITLEHARIAFVVVNLVGLGMLLPVSWELARKNIWLHALGAYLLLMQTPARSILWYKHMSSLGWADLIRTALATVALFGAVNVPDGAGAARTLGLWGVVMGFALLYSQEFGLCAAGAVVVALLADRLLLTRAPFRARLKKGALASAVFTAGMLGPPLGLLAIYAAKGRAGRLITTAYESLAFASAGVWGSIPFPITKESVVAPTILLREFSNWSGHFDSPIIFLLPVMVYVVAGLALAARLAGGRWTRRATLELALLAFGVTSYRVTMATPDIWHLLSTTTPAILLVIALSADAMGFRWHLSDRRLVLPLGRAAMVALAVVVVCFGEFSTGIVRKLAEINDGHEKQSGPTPYVHPDIPRAGDVLIPAHVRGIVSFIHREVERDEPIFISAGMFEGAELYFLSDRRNPSRFDTLSELVTQSRRAELLQTLKDDPPKLIIGNEMSLFDAPIVDYIAQRWEPPVVQDGYTVRRRKK